MAMEGLWSVDSLKIESKKQSTCQAIHQQWRWTSLFQHLSCKGLPLRTIMWLFMRQIQSTKHSEVSGNDPQLVSKGCLVIIAFFNWEPETAFWLTVWTFGLKFSCISVHQLVLHCVSSLCPSRSQVDWPVVDTHKVHLWSSWWVDLTMSLCLPVEAVFSWRVLSLLWSERIGLGHFRYPNLCVCTSSVALKNTWEILINMKPSWRLCCMWVSVCHPTHCFPLCLAWTDLTSRAQVLMSGEWAQCETGTCVPHRDRRASMNNHQIVCIKVNGNFWFITSNFWMAAAEVILWISGSFCPNPRSQRFWAIGETWALFAKNSELVHCGRSNACCERFRDDTTGWFPFCALWNDHLMSSKTISLCVQRWVISWCQCTKDL